MVPYSSRHTAGWTYCGIGVLKILGRLPGNDFLEDGSGARVGNATVHNLLHWLVSRQTVDIAEGDAGLLAAEPEGTSAATSTNFQKERSYPVKPSEQANETDLTSTIHASGLHFAGFNGRCNKVADTCYAFWVGASLSVWNALSQFLHLRLMNW